MPRGKGARRGGGGARVRGLGGKIRERSLGDGKRWKSTGKGEYLGRGLGLVCGGTRGA